MGEDVQGGFPEGEVIRKRAKRRRVNVIAGAAIAAVAVAALVAVWFYGASTDGASAIVVDGDGNEYTLPLDEDTTLEVTTGLGTNIIVVEDGCVWVEEADCPNHDCMEQGKVSSAGQQIVCLPHELVITISDEDGESEFDVMGS